MWSRIRAAEPDLVGGGEAEEEAAEQNNWGLVVAALPENDDGGSGDVEATSLFADVGPVKRKRGRPKKVMESAALPSSSQAMPSTATHVSSSEQLSSVGLSLQTHPLAATTGTRHIARTIDVSMPLVKRARQGRMMVPELVQLVAQAHAISQGAGFVEDEATKQLCHVYFDAGKFHLASKVVEQQLMQVDASVRGQRLARLASSLVLEQIYEKLLMEERISSGQPPGTLVMMFECVAYDETPLKLMVQEPVSSLDEVSAELQLPSYLRVASTVSQQHSKQTIIAKVLQTKSSCGYLLQASSNLVGILIDWLCPLQSMERVSGACLRECLGRQSPLSRHVESFTFKLRAITCDRAKYNKAAEDLLAGDRGKSWQKSMMFCDVHGVSLCHEKSIEALLSSDVSGLLHIGLSFRVGHVWNQFKRSLEQEVMARELIIVDFVPDDALEFKTALVNMWLAGNQGSGLDKCLTLLSFCSGDWRKASVIEFCCPPGQQVPQTAILKKHIAKTIVGTLCAHPPHIYPKHRWTGFQKSIMDVLMLESLHGLLLSSYQRMCKSLGHKCAKSEARLLRVPNAGGDVAQGSHVLSDEAHAQEQPLGEVVATDVTNVEQPSVVEGGGVSLAEQNKKDREKGLLWLEGRPMARLLLMAVAVEPLQKLMHQHFLYCGQEWELKERAKEAKTILDGAGLRRSYRLEVAAAGTLEKQFMADLAKVFWNRLVWQVFPEGAYGNQFRCLAFIALGRSGAAVTQIVSHPHSLYPWKCYKLLTDASLGADMQEEPLCLKDAFTIKLQEMHGLDNALTVEKLRMLALKQSADIAGLESKHASIRRQVVLKSTQAWPMTFAESSAQWLVQSFRRWKPAARTTAATTATSACKARVVIEKQFSQPCPHSLFWRNCHLSK
eukprot:6465706-Amphidinium_carterae.1